MWCIAPLATPMSHSSHMTLPHADSFLQSLASQVSEIELWNFELLSSWYFSHCVHDKRVQPQFWGMERLLNLSPWMSTQFMDLKVRKLSQQVEWNSAGMVSSGEVSIKKMPLFKSFWHATLQPAYRLPLEGTEKGQRPTHLKTPLGQSRVFFSLSREGMSQPTHCGRILKECVELWITDLSTKGSQTLEKACICSSDHWNLLGTWSFKANQVKDREGLQQSWAKQEKWHPL